MAPLAANARTRPIIFLIVPLAFFLGFYSGIWSYTSRDSGLTKTFLPSFSRTADQLSSLKRANRTENVKSVDASAVTESFSVPTVSNNGVISEAKDTQKERVLAQIFYPDDSSNSSTTYCQKHPSACQNNENIKSHLKKRKRFSAQQRLGPNFSIYTSQELPSFYGDQPWFRSLGNCPLSNCRVTSNPGDANVILCNHRPPPDMRENVAYAVFNLEPHTFTSLPTHPDNMILVSYHQESDLVINYGFHVTHKGAVCMDQDIPNQVCDNLRTTSTPFQKWCNAKSPGDIFGCIFNVLPHIMRQNQVNRSGFAATWISQTCQRHDDYLKRLMQYIQIDSMGGCQRNREETSHPAMSVKDFDNLWWGPDRKASDIPGGYGIRKTIIASHYWFFISIENTIIDDYVSEKFYEGFLSDSLLVYFGAPNARKYAPAPHSFINALDFEGPAELANFLKELQNDVERYESYFWWKRTLPKPNVSPKFVEDMRYSLELSNSDSVLCRMCRKLSETPAQ